MRKETEIVADGIGIELLLFGQIRDIVGKDRMAIEMDSDCSLPDFSAILTDRFPRLANQKLLFAVNEEYVSADTILKDGDTVAIFTPVSGG